MPRLSLLYLLALALLTGGYGIGRYEVFPSDYIRQVEDFILGHELGTDTNLVEKLANDTGIAPLRFKQSFPARAAIGTRSIAVAGIGSRREAPLVFLADDHRQGYRAVFGVLDYGDTFWGGLLLGPDGQVIHSWKLSAEHLNDVSERNQQLYGLHLFPDGSVIFSQQEAAGGLVKVDACSNVVWSRPGSFHHAVSATDDGHFWSFQGRQDDFDHKLVKIAVDSGEIIQTIDMQEARELNEFIHIFDLQKRPGPEKADISHGNDIEALSAEMSKYFPQFASGDLLISYRTQNLVFVLDPDDLKIKWWRIGAWDRQHDPDWETDGSIVVFSNNTRTARRHSDIVAIDPVTLQHRVLVNGTDMDFYSSINGQHAATPYGTRMITSTTQGWAFEVDRANNIVFSFVNNYEEDSRDSLNVAEALRFDDDYFSVDFWNQCTG